MKLYCRVRVSCDKVMVGYLSRLDSLDNYESRGPVTRHQAPDRAAPDVDMWPRCRGVRTTEQSPSLSHCLIFADIWHSHCFDDFANFAKKKKQYGYRKYRLHALQWVRNVKLLSTCIQHYKINNLQVLCMWTYVAVEMPSLPLPLLLNRMS